MAQILDPLRLFYHLQDLQRALFGPTSSASPDTEGTSHAVVLPFCINRCLAGSGPAEASNSEESWREQLPHADTPDPVFAGQPGQVAGRHAPSTRMSDCSSPCAPSQQAVEESSFSSQPTKEEEVTTSRVSALDSSPRVRQPRASHTSASRIRSRHKPAALTIEQAIREYLEDQRSRHRRPKTLEWHEHALGLFQYYLLTEHQCLLLGQITETQVRGRLAFLAQMPSARGPLRQISTVQSYARSARAFCRWLLRHKYRHATPFAHLPLPKVESRVLHPLAPEEWERLLLACHSARKTDVLAERATARNRAILWLLFDTGMRVSEISGLRLCDVDRDQGILLIRGRGARTRRLTLGQEGIRHLRAYLDTYYQGAAACRAERGASEDHLFLSETGRPLTRNGMALLFARLRKGAGITRKDVNPSLLRESFELRYLKTGGEPFILQELLGCPDQSSSTHNRHLIDQALAQQPDERGERVP